MKNFQFLDLKIFSMDHYPAMGVKVGTIIIEEKKEHACLLVHVLPCTFTPHYIIIDKGPLCFCLSNAIWFKCHVVAEHHCVSGVPRVRLRKI